MPDLHPATPAELADALAHALRFDGRRPFRAAESFMADIAAAHLVRVLEASGFVVMRKPPVQAPTTGTMIPDRRGGGTSGGS